jgi:hypothetical protein
MIRRIDCCAAPVIESASSRITILCRPAGSVTFFCANSLMRLRTTWGGWRGEGKRRQVSDASSAPPRTRHTAASDREMRKARCATQERSGPLGASATHINATIIRRVQLQHSIAKSIPKELPREAKHARRLARPRWASKDEVWQVAIARNHAQPLHRKLVPSHILQHPWSVLFDPRCLEFERACHCCHRRAGKPRRVATRRGMISFRIQNLNSHNSFEKKIQKSMNRRAINTVDS